MLPEDTPGQSWIGEMVGRYVCGGGCEILGSGLSGELCRKAAVDVMRFISL